jgi:putative nucleotidyltransferase with HDIG domain
MTQPDEIKDKIDKLPPIPQVMHQILELASDPQATASDLANVILIDPAITANMLQACNSAYFDPAAQVDSIQHASAVLSMDQIIELAIIHHVTDYLKQPQTGCDLAIGDLWKQSAASALLAKAIATSKGVSEVPILFTAAVLRDIGKIVLGEFMEEAGEKILKLVSEQGCSFSEAENEVFSIDHATLGAMIADQWNFNGKTAHIIRYHHEPLQGSHDDFDTAIVYLADIIANMVGPINGIDQLANRSYGMVLKTLGYSGFDIFRLITEYHTSVQKAEMMLNATTSN